MNKIYPYSRKLEPSSEKPELPPIASFERMAFPNYVAVTNPEFIFDQDKFDQSIKDVRKSLIDTVNEKAKEELDNCFDKYVNIDNDPIIIEATIPIDVGDEMKKLFELSKEVFKR